MKKVHFILLFFALIFSNSFAQVTTLSFPSENNVVYNNTIAVSNPTVTITGSVVNSTSSPFTATFTFSEAIQNFSLSDVIVTNATSSVFNKISDSKYTALITPTSDGIVTINIPANSLQDLANNDNLASNTFSINYDTTKPTVTITSDKTSPVNDSGFVATFTFSENVADFDETYFVLSKNATFSNFVYVNDALFKVTITPILEGVVTISIPGGNVEDTAGNTLSATQFSINVDISRPTTTLLGLVTNPTKSAFTTTINFSEDVTGFDINDITLTNATASNFITTNAKSYAALITPITDGSVTVNVASNVAFDIANNGNSSGNQVSTIYDTTGPSVTISGSSTNKTNAAFTATFDFNEDVKDFTESDIFTNNATVSVFNKVNERKYTALITPISEGIVTLNISANSVLDIANNFNTAGGSFSIEYDITKPSVVITADKTNPTNATSFVATFTFSEDINDFDELYFSVTNGSTNNFTTVSSSVYKVTITPLADGTVSINLPENATNDNAENGNIAALFTIDVDTVKPTTTITSTITNQTNAAFTTIITFSENISGFDINDITLGNATVSNFTSTNPKVYSALITPILDGIVTIDITNDIAFDAATNGNIAAAQFSTTFDGTNPSVIITADKTNPSNAANFIATFTFSEDVINFEESHFSITNGSSSNFSMLNQKVYTAVITPISDGLVTINLPENKATDTFGNGNVTAQFSINIDTTNPTTTITSSVSNKTNSAFTTTITFSEDVTGFDLGDLTLGNATASNFTTTSSAVYTALITPTSDGVVTINIASNVANDAALNGNTTALPFSITYDGTKPVAPSVLYVDSYTCARDNTTTADNTLIFHGTSEPNTILEVFLNNVSIGNTSVNANGTWSFDYTSVALSDGSYSITAKATDASNNTSDFSSTFTIKISTVDTDGDLIPDFCDDDDDNDGVLDIFDNSYLPNPGQEDTDGDGIADVEEDCDNDGIINYFDKDVASCQGTIVMKEKYGFSPNGDGINETWVIENIALYPNNIVHIYNRSGKLVYQMKGYKNTFNGFSNKVNSGKKLPVGAYYFTIEFNTPNSKPAKGWLYINY